MALSSRGAVGALVLSLPLLLSSCASTQDREVKKLQARSSYEQGLRNLSEKRVSLGMAAIKEAVELDPENATYHMTLGVVLLDLKRSAVRRGPGRVPDRPGARQEQSRSSPQSRARLCRAEPARRGRRCVQEGPVLSDLRHARGRVLQPRQRLHQARQGAGSRGIVPGRRPARADAHLRSLRPRRGIDARGEARPGQGVLPDGPGFGPRVPLR